MKVKILAAAVAAAVLAPAAQADVTIAGTIAPFIGVTNNKSTSDTVGALGGTVSGVSGFTSIAPNDASSRFSIDSSEDLGNGMKAGAYVQLRGQDGTFNDFNQTGTTGINVFRYNANIGGGWGTLKVGREFSPYTWTMILNDPNGGAIWFGPFATMGHAGGQGLSLNGGPGATIHAFFRVGTGLHYESPDISGFSFKASWMSEGAKNATQNSDVTEWGGSVDYKPADMPFYLGAAYQHRSNANGAAPMAPALGGGQSFAPGTFGGSTDNLWLVGGGAVFGDLKIGLWIEGVKYKTDGVTAGLSELKRTAFWIPVSYTLPTGKLGAAYQQAGDLDGNNVGGSFNGSDTGAKAIQLSYIHNLSKQTQPYVMYQYLDSDSGGVYAGNGLGGRASMFIVGLQHSF